MARRRGSHSDITGPKIRDAALRLIAQHGCAAVSMRKIADEVGLQVGALYNYTPDKQSLLFDLMETHMHDLLAELGKLPALDGPIEQLDQFVRFHITYHLPRRNEVFVSYMELRNLSPENFEKIQLLRSQYEGVLEAILKTGEESDDFALTDRHITTLSIIAQLTGITNWYREDGRLTIDEVATIYCDLIQKSISSAQA